MRYSLVCIMFLATTALVIAKNSKSTSHRLVIQLSEKADTLKEGQHLYENKCGSCHFLYKPIKYTKVEWDLHLYKMTKKAKLSDVEMDKLKKYLFENCRKD
jgi:hypothetical protein